MGRMRQIEAEAQQVRAEAVSCTASLVQQQVGMSARIAALESQVESQASIVKTHNSTKEESQLEQLEQARVSTEELVTRNGGFASETQLINASLEESRRSWPDMEFTVLRER